MSRAISSFALVAVACRFDPSGPAGDAVDGADGVDGGGEVLLEDLHLAGPAHYVYDTSSGALARDGGDPIEVASEVLDGVRVVDLGSLVVDARAELRVVGALPLAVTAASTIAIAGTLDASASLGAGDAAGESGRTVSLLARARLAVGGRVLVGGAGGAGGALSSPGGDGGAGGAITLGGHEILLAEHAVLSANGGGGGEGGDADDVGRPGEDAPADGRRAHGGAGQANDGGDGGEGAGDMDATGKPGKAGTGAEGAAGGAGGTGGSIRLVGLVTDGGARITPSY